MQWDSQNFQHDLTENLLPEEHPSPRVMLRQHNPERVDALPYHVFSQFGRHRSWYMSNLISLHIFHS